jgi:2-(1,2-epoxy-1,2-dihydrophenyl)acetyl-CoA isomerase
MSVVTMDCVDDVAIVRLNEPATFNALSLTMTEELRAVLSQCEQNSRAIVLSGTGKAFCSGASLKGGTLTSAQPGESLDAGRALDSHYNPLMLAIRSLSIPFVTAVHGAAAGIGCSLALVGDLIVADTTAYFLQAFKNIGLVPDGGSPFLLAASAGRARAMEAMLLGERISAETAHSWGLINRVAQEGRAVDVALGLATKLAQGPRMALALTREIAWSALERPFADQLGRERAAQKRAGESGEFREGLAAFLEKRPPRFGIVKANGEIEPHS